jgi:hypothetical protein
MVTSVVFPSTYERGIIMGKRPDLPTDMRVEREMSQLKKQPIAP